MAWVAGIWPLPVVGGSRTYALAKYFENFSLKIMVAFATFRGKVTGPPSFKLPDNTTLGFPSSNASYFPPVALLGKEKILKQLPVLKPTE